MTDKGHGCRSHPRPVLDPEKKGRPREERPQTGSYEKLLPAPVDLTQGEPESSRGVTTK